MSDSVYQAQSKPAAGVLTDLTAIAGNTTIGTIDACNHSATVADNIRVSIAFAGAADTAAQYVIGGNTSGGLPVDPNDTFSQTKGWNLKAGDVIRVYSANGTTSFNISGVRWD